jgi:hypothetical protein
MAHLVLQKAGAMVMGRTFAWTEWRLLMLHNPEGDVVELVADDPHPFLSLRQMSKRFGFGR